MLWGMGLAAKRPGLDEKKLRPKAGGRSARRCLRRSPGVLLMSTNRFKPHPEKKKLNGTIWRSASSSPSHQWGEGNPGREPGHAAGAGHQPRVWQRPGIPLPTGWLGEGETPTVAKPGSGVAKGWRGPVGSRHVLSGRAGRSSSLQGQAKLFLYIIISPKLAQPPPRAAFSSAKPTWKFELSGLPRTPSCSPLLPSWDPPNPGQGGRWHKLHPGLSPQGMGQRPGTLVPPLKV